MAISERKIMPAIVRRTRAKVLRRRADLDMGRRPAWGRRLLVANVTLYFQYLVKYVVDLWAYQNRKQRNWAKSVKRSTSYETDLLGRQHTNWQRFYQKLWQLDLGNISYNRR